jgi:hypothetical protein
MGMDAVQVAKFKVYFNAVKQTLHIAGAQFHFISKYHQY